MKILWLTFTTLFLAELGDKTQLAVITLTSSTKNPLLVFLGAALALTLVSLIGVLVGEALTKFVPVPVIKKIASLAFIVIGALMFFNKM